MIVCIAEKPSVAKDIARIIGANQVKNGYMEGNGYQVTWTYGHLCRLKEPDDYTENWKHWSLAALPMIPQKFGIKLIDDDGIRRQFAIVRQLFSHAEKIINCGDAGQEGELIQRWVMQKAQVRCPVERLWINSLTDEAIREGFRDLKDEACYRPLYFAGLSRAIGDWLLGMNATRLYTLKYGHYKQVLSIGRVQTPTLALIVKRQKEIDEFIPEPYWVLATVYRDTTFTAAKGKFSSEGEGRKAFESIAGKPFVVTAVEKKKGTEAPRQLYDLTSLQVDCNSKFGFSAETTLNLIQGLYEKKVTTYPRVDTQYLSDDIYPKCPQIMNGLYKARFSGKNIYADFIKPLGGKALRKSKKVFDTSKVTDHHAIIPTGIAPQNLSDMERKVYDLIARRFISVFYPDCKFSTTAVKGQVDEVVFSANGKEIIDPGWRVVYDKDHVKEDSKKTNILPVFVKGESGSHEPTLTKKLTTPPKHYTEATLLRDMETAGKYVDDEELRYALKENGIGRPSSRAGIIETLFKRRYIRRNKKNLIATPTGIELIDMIHEKLLTSCELTGIWEKRLRNIERKEEDPADFINGLKGQIAKIVNDVLADNSNRQITFMPEQPKETKSKERKKRPGKSKNKPLGADDSIIGKPCPKCGKGKIVKGSTSYGCSDWRNGCDFRLPFAPE